MAKLLAILTSTKIPMAIWGLLLLLLGSLVVHTWASADTWMHLHRGMSILQTGTSMPATNLVLQHPDAAFYWLFQVMLFGLYEVGETPLVTLSFLGVWILAFAVLWRSCNLKSSGVAAWLWLFGGILVSSDRFAIRPEAFSYMFMSVFLYALLVWLPKIELKASKQWLALGLALILTQILWVNMHGYFVIGIGLVGLKLLATVFHSGERLASIRLSILLVMLVLASLVSPFGYQTLTAAYNHLFLMGGLSERIGEFAAPSIVKYYSSLWYVNIFWLMWGTTAVIVVARIYTTRRMEFETLLALTGLILGAKAMRTLPLLVWFASPLVGQVLDSGRLLSKRSIRISSGSYMVYAALTVMSVVTIGSVVTNWYYDSLSSHRRFGIGQAARFSPETLKNYFSRHDFQGRIFNVDYLGGFLEFHFPELKLYGDTQFTNVQDTIEYTDAWRPEGFASLDNKHRFDAALVDVFAFGQLAAKMFISSEWQLVYGDAYRALFVRTSSPYASQLPIETPEFFAGISTERMTNEGMYPLTWALILAYTNQKPLLKELLLQAGRQEFVPAPLLQNALSFALQHEDREIAELVAPLLSRMTAFKEESELAKVEQLWTRAENIKAKM